MGTRLNVLRRKGIVLFLALTARSVCGSNLVTVRLKLSGIHRTLNVLDKWRHDGDLYGPSTDSKNAEEEFIVMGIHWTKTKVYHSVVVLTYMHHGIM